MTALRQVLLVAWRDFFQRARSRAFLVSMLIIVAVVAGVGPLMALQDRTPEPYTIGVIGAAPAALEPALDRAAAAFDRTVETVTFDSVDSGETALEDGDADVLLVDGAELVWKEEPRLQLGAIVNSAIQGLERQRTIAELGLSDADAARLLHPDALDTRTLTQPDPSAGPRRIASYVGSILLYISILMFGQFVMLGVMEEKQSRVVEVVLSRTRPSRLLAGKVLGIGALGFLQLVVLGGAALLTLSATNAIDVDLAGIGMRIVGAVLFWYLLGYTLFAVVYAALGATVSRQEDAQGVGMIPILGILPGFFLSIVALDDPNGTLPHLGSIIPPFSPFVMPIRMTVTSVPLWEVVLSIALILVTTYWVLRLGARVYQGSILRIGAKTRLRDALKAGSER
ncbi:ABC-2 family transporter protein [bacterium BMS3Abin02]|nr:ABC-2 family transporter protein [bacterium BMS3Abin02]GBE20844.1 ABC-2 family transporter protein [bacterium BMS3Bbin01]HDH26936.1 ABC transporter permease [Actinomycetota bacterium]